MLKCCSCGCCTNCEEQTPYSGEVYCAGCSWMFESYYECKEKIKEGNYYIKDIKEEIDKRIYEHQQELTRNISNYEEENKYYEEEKKILNEEYIKLVNSYSNKSKEDILKMMIDK